MKKVDTFEYVSVLKELVEEGREVSMLISGSSMSPFLCHERDRVFFKAPDRPLRVGDMVFYQRRSGQYVLHRICKVKDGSYFIVGDAQTEIEGPVRREQIFALVTKVQRKGRLLGPGNFWWEFFARVWIRLIPLRPLLVRAYGLFHRKRFT
ncbi:MAG: S24/S26 family peptidase [Candidatus Limivicinus sp.]|nr:S24/S26 family peptidase [Clostridiales bacterium]MDY6133140.1 S24/S26 family peptidase [Candidatus Limivicinus sp.]